MKISLEEAMKIANRAYNQGFKDAGGVVEDEDVPAEGSWEHKVLLQIIHEVVGTEDPSSSENGVEIVTAIRVVAENLYRNVEEAEEILARGDTVPAFELSSLLRFDLDVLGKRLSELKSLKYITK